jgi:hypothetical protein
MVKKPISRYCPFKDHLSPGRPGVLQGSPLHPRASLLHHSQDPLQGYVQQTTVFWNTAFILHFLIGRVMRSLNPYFTLYLYSMKSYWEKQS